MSVRFDPVRILLLAAGGFALLAAPLPLHAQDKEAKTDAARAAELRAGVPNLPHLVRTAPNIYLIRVENIDTPAPEPGAEPGTPPSKVTATVEKTIKGKRAKKLALTVVQRRPGAADAGLFGGTAGGDPDAIQNLPVFFSPQRFLSPRNPMFGGPSFEKNRLFLVFTDINAERLLGGPYGYQRVSSPEAFWVQTVKRLVANPDSKHAVEMSYREFITRHRSAFLMVIADCLGTEVSISEPLWGEPVSRGDIDPARILPESAGECADAMEEKRGYLGLIEAEPWLYQARRGYPNQSYVEIRDDKLDFSELGYDIDFPGGGVIPVAELAARMSGGQPR